MQKSDVEKEVGIIAERLKLIARAKRAGRQAGCSGHETSGLESIKELS
ncbi:hypothetical protein [Endozoicomonas sp.]|nr:hypothetical protein [Endozoicomonas sp.]